MRSSVLFGIAVTVLLLAVGIAMVSPMDDADGTAPIYVMNNGLEIELTGTSPYFSCDPTYNSYDFVLTIASESGAYEWKKDGTTVSTERTYSIKNNAESGIYVAYNNSSMIATLTITVHKADLTVRANDNTITYGDEPSDNGKTFEGFLGTDTESVVTGTVTYTYDYTQYGTVGNYSIRPYIFDLSADNYEFSSVDGILTVEKKPLTVTANDKTIIYGDAPANDGRTIDGFVNGDTEAVITGSVTYSYNYEQYDDTGTYSIIPDVSGLSATNYSFNPVSGTLRVDKNTLTVTANDKTITYGDMPPTYSKTITGFVGTDTESVVTGSVIYDCEYGQFDDTDQYPIRVDVGGLSASNYEFSSVDGTLTVEKKPLTVTANDKTITYGDAPANDGRTIDGFVNGDDESVITGDVIYSYTYEQYDDVGDYLITPITSWMYADNYCFTSVNGTLKVDQKTLDTIHVCGTQYYDGQTSRIIDVDTKVNSQTLNVTVSFYDGSIPSSTVRSYSFGTSGYHYSVDNRTWSDGTGKVANYDIQLGSTGHDCIVIVERDVTVTAKEQIIAYGNSIDTSINQAIPINLASGHKLSSVTLTADLFNNSINVSGALIRDSDNNNVTGNYNITYGSGYLIVNKVDAVITAADQTITYGGHIDASVSKASLSGYKYSDSLSSITLVGDEINGKVVVSAALILDSSSRDVTGFYNITYVNGILTVIQRSITISALDQTIIYGDSIDGSVSKASPSYLASGDVLSAITLAPSISDCGIGVITPSGASIKDSEDHDVTGFYTISYADGTLTINTRPVSMTIPSKTTEYDGSNIREVTLSVTISAEHQETLIAELGFDSKDVGMYSDYTVKWKDDTGKASNFSITISSKGTQTVEERSVTMTVPDCSFEYDGSTRSIVVYSNTDVGETLRMTLTAGSEVPGTYTYGTGVKCYTASGWNDGTGKVSNYDVDTDYKGQLKILRKEIAITALNQSITYGENITVSVDKVTISGTVSGHILDSIGIVASSTDVGEQKLTPYGAVIHNGSSGDVTEYYAITYVDGVLTIGRKDLTVDIPSKIFSYDGLDIKEMEYFVKDGRLTDQNPNDPLEEGNDPVPEKTLIAQLKLPSINIGTYTDYQITWVDGTEKASNYNVTVVEKGTITVTKADVVMKIPYCSYEFKDGNVWDVPVKTNAKNNETLTAEITTSSSEAHTYTYGSEEYCYTYVWKDGTGSLDNYNITSTECEYFFVIAQKVIQLTFVDSKTYDGTPIAHTIKESELTGLVEGDRLCEGSVESLSSDSGDHSDKTMWKYTAAIVLEKGVENYSIQCNNMSLMIVPREITITSSTASAVEGTFTESLKCEKISSVGGAGYLSGEELTYTFTGSQKEIGSSDNTFSCADSGTAKLKNYSISYVYGTLKVISKDSASVEIEVKTGSLTEQQQADIAASAEYYKQIGDIRPVIIRISSASITVSSDFIRSVSVDSSAPVMICAPDGSIVITGDAISKSIENTESFTATIQNVEKTEDCIAEFEVSLSADGIEIHELGASVTVTFRIDNSAMFPIDRDFKVKSVSDGEKYDADYDKDESTVTFTAGHLSHYAVVLPDGVSGSPSFTGVILVIVISLILIIGAGAAIYYLKKKFYI